MGRSLRLNIENGYFHIISKSVEETNLFNESDDYNKFLKILSEEKEKHKVVLYSYCLMPNHYHLLIKTNDTNLSEFMKNLNFRYSQYFNNKNFRTGHLFMDRFKSFYINNEGYFLNVSRYIHLNPIESNIVDKPEKYNWSSYKFYYFDLKTELIDKNSFYEIVSMKKEDYLNYVDELYNYILFTRNEKLNQEKEGEFNELGEIINYLERKFSVVQDKKLFKNLIIFYLLNKNFSPQKLSSFFNVSKTHLYRIANKIESEIKMNPNILKLYNDIEKSSLLKEY